MCIPPITTRGFSRPFIDPGVQRFWCNGNIVMRMFYRYLKHLSLCLRSYVYGSASEYHTQHTHTHTHTQCVSAPGSRFISFVLLLLSFAASLLLHATNHFALQIQLNRIRCIVLIPSYTNTLQRTVFLFETTFYSRNLFPPKIHKKIFAELVAKDL